MTTSNWISPLGGGEVSADKLGSHGARLTELSTLGLAVDPGFVITPGACAEVGANKGELTAGLRSAIAQGVAGLSDGTTLLAVRTGASGEMPGIPDNLTNVGLSRRVVEGLVAAEPTAEGAIWAEYASFIRSFGVAVLGIHDSRFARNDDDSAPASALATAYEGVLTAAGKDLPDDVGVQLELIIKAIYAGFHSHRARYYRKSHGLEDAAGVGITVQTMTKLASVSESGRGDFFSRNPKTGEVGLVGEWRPIGRADAAPLDALGTHHPQVLEALSAAGATLERHYRCAQQVTFSVRNGSLTFTDSRPAALSAQAQVQSVVDYVHEGLISQDEAILAVEPTTLERVMQPTVAADAPRRVIAHGLDASPGAASGRVVFHAEDCQEFLDRGEPTILVRNDTSPEDIQGMTVASGLLTARGGQTSHAAVLARSMGKPAVVGCTEIQVDYSRQLFYAGDSVVRRGDWITVDGSSGDVLDGQVKMDAPGTELEALQTLLAWADGKARLAVRANADSAADASRARGLGAMGIGLCRTEHMFFLPDALRAMRKMILADDPWARQRALNDILPMQRSVFADLFRAMDGLPVTVRLLDPPLHEFLPTRDEDISEIAASLGVRVDALQARLQRLKESNPMLGHRGVRLGISTPEVYKTQVRALFEAAVECVKGGTSVSIEILVPLVSMSSELEKMRALIAEVAEAVFAEHDQGVDYAVGAMVEVPRACLTAGDLALQADFFSVGTNDLTQLVYGFSRDDMSSFMPAYQRDGVLSADPMVQFDVDGVGAMVKRGVEDGRKASSQLGVGVCGEHGADPSGVKFFHQLGVDYVSCSPFRVPVARLAAAHAALTE